MRFKKNEDGSLVLDDDGNPIAIDGDGNTIPLDKVVSLGKHQRIEGERDEYKAEAEKLRGEIGDLKKSAGNAEELKAKVDELTAATETAKTDFESKMAAREKEHALDTALLASGVKPAALKAAKVYVDLDKLELDGEALNGFDAETFKKDQPFLFDAQSTVSTGGPSRGSGGGTDEDQTRAAMGLKPKE